MQSPIVRSRPLASDSFRSVAERWTSGELHRAYPDHIAEKRTADDDRYRMERHLYPVAGGSRGAVSTSPAEG
jgi:hypothetical protein